MVRVSSENCQNWFWPNWPCSRSRANQFSRSCAGAAANAREFSCSRWKARRKFWRSKKDSKMPESDNDKFGLEEEETKLITWSSKSTKLLISLRRENDSLFSKGKVRKNVAWKRIADQFNSTSSVKVTGEQCSNKWKKLEEKYKKVSEHNSRTGNDRKECESQDEMTEFFGSNPKIVPAATVSSMAMEAGTADHSDDEDEELPRKTPPKKKKRRSSKSSASEMIEFLKEFKDDKRKEELEKMSLSQKMHEEKMSIMNRFLDILSKKEG